MYFYRKKSESFAEEPEHITALKFLTTEEMDVPRLSVSYTDRRKVQRISRKNLLVRIKKMSCHDSLYHIKRAHYIAIARMWRRAEHIDPMGLWLLLWGVKMGS